MIKLIKGKLNISIKNRKKIINKLKNIINEKDEIIKQKDKIIAEQSDLVDFMLKQMNIHKEKSVKLRKQIKELKIKGGEKNDKGK